MSIRGLLQNFVIFLAMYAGLLLLLTIGEDLIAPALKARKAAADSRILSPVYATAGEAVQIYADLARVKSDYAPFTGWRTRPMETATINVVPDGRRQHRHATGRDPARPAVGFFGGSAMWGVGVDDNGTIPAQFETMAEGAYSAVNYATRGFTSRQSLAALINLINQGKMPDVVIFHDGFADIWTLCNRAVTTELNGHIQERKIAAALLASTETSKFYSVFIAPLFNLALRIRGKPKWDKRLACTADPARGDAVVSAMLKNWEMAHRLVEAEGGRFFAFLQPTRYLSKAGRRGADQVGSAKSRALGVEFAALYPRFMAHIDSPNMPWAFDLTRLYDKARKTVFLDDAHVSAEGNAKQAAMILEIVRRFSK